MIVKVQRSLTTTEKYQQLLIYNASRSKCMQFNLGDDWARYFRKRELKFFAEVDWPILTEPPKLIRKLPDQGW